MSTYTIGQVADRTGFTASALRYYERVGLVSPVKRTDAGYRIYDDDTLSRLSFIARAKQLGCTLDEITDLVEIWDGDQCGPVQRRFHDLVSGKIATTQDQIAELAAFGSQLRSAAAHLRSEPIDGPCGDGCACVSDSNVTAPVALVGKPSDDAPIVCTLDGASMPARLSDWQALLDRVQSRSAAADGALRIEFADDIDVNELVRLVTAEQECCTFFSFAITVDGRGTALEVRAPADAAELVDVVFGKAS